MSKGKSDLKQYLMAYKLHKTGKRQQQILDGLEKLGFEVMAKRTVADWIKEFKNVEQTIQSLDNPFIWRKCGEYGIPDDKSALENVLFYCDVYTTRNDDRLPSIREVKWIHLLDSTAEGKWEADKLVDLATRYAETELGVALKRQQEDDFENLDQEFYSERKKISFDPRRRR
tara:strand:+ start:218 stop:733 length:516 start_codon:yes stop_codon:yes gene_type:complete